MIERLHVGLVVLSVSGFIARALPALRSGRRWTTNRWLYAAPHVVDTLLLASGVWLALQVGWRPTVHAWFGVKLVLVAIYITLGALAMRPRLPRPARVAAFLLALATVAWIACVAYTKSPLGPLA